MAYVLVHRSKQQELRFPSPTAAAAYAKRHGGGVRKWIVTTAGRRDVDLVPRLGLAGGQL
jgi:hypothetical protein